MVPTYQHTHRETKFPHSHARAIDNTDSFRYLKLLVLPSMCPTSVGTQSSYQIYIIIGIDKKFLSSDRG